MIELIGSATDGVCHLSIADLSGICRCSVEIVEDALSEIVSNDLATINSRGVVICEWDEQFAIRKCDRPEFARERSKRRREREQNVTVTQEVVTVTSEPVTVMLPINSAVEPNASNGHHRNVTVTSHSDGLSDSNGVEMPELEVDNARIREGCAHGDALSDKNVSKVINLKSEIDTSLNSDERASLQNGDVDKRVYEILSIFDLPITPRNVDLCQRRLLKYGAKLPANYDLVEAALACHQHHVNAHTKVKDWFGRWDTWMSHAIDGWGTKTHIAAKTTSNGKIGPRPDDYKLCKKTGVAIWDQLMPYFTMLSRTNMLPQRMLRDPTYKKFTPVSREGNTINLKPAPEIIEYDLGVWQKTIKIVAKEWLKENVEVHWIT